MKTWKQFAAILITLLWVISLEAQRVTPCLCDPANTTEKQPCHLLNASPSPINSSSNRITLQMKNDTNTLDKYEFARYKAFWIWGDGNYRYFPHGEKSQDESTLTQSYGYRKAGAFIPTVVLVEKKSNKQPPDRRYSSRRVSVAIPASTANQDTFARRLNVPLKSADIFSTEDLRAGSFHTAMVVSAPKDTLSTGIFFFYNCISDAEGKQYTSAHVHDLEEGNLILPAYVPSGSVIKGQMTEMLTNYPDLVSMLTSTVYYNLANIYQSFIYVPVTSEALNAMSNGFDEYRFFPVLTTVWQDTLATSNFMALVVGSQAPEGGFYDEKRLTDMHGTLDGFYIPQFDFTSERINKSALARGFEGPDDFQLGVDPRFNNAPVYARGVYRTDVRIVGSIDPNELKVLKICPQGNGQYKVDMHLEICNEGYHFENSIDIKLKDTDNHFATLQLPDTEKSKILNLNDSLYANGYHEWSFTWKQFLADIYDTLSTGSIEYAPHCAGFDFSIVSDWAGVQKLQKGEGLEMCVVFSLATVKKPDCGFNFAIEGAVTEASGYNCGVPDNECPCGWLCWFLIILLLLLLWWWYRQQNDTPNT